MHWTTKIALCLVSIWIAVCLLSLPDMQMGQRIYSTVATYDHSVRSAFIASALRAGAPPANPFFYAGFPVRARYYYYWNVLCALPAYMSAANSRVVLYASCIWSGLLLASIIPIYLKHFLKQHSNLRIASLLGIGLIAITGLDIVPALARIFVLHALPTADMEWWDPCQVTSWLDALIWVPHHVAALVACLAGYLFLWTSIFTKERSTRIWLFLFAAAGFSSGAGLSVYVTLTFGVFILAWVIYLLARGRILVAGLHAGAGALALLLSIGYIDDLLGPGTSGGRGTSAHFLAFARRQLPLDTNALAGILGFHSYLADMCFWVLIALFVLFLELGPYMLVGLIQADRDWRRRRTLPEEQKSLWFMAGSSLAIAMSVRSTVIGTNDLAYRGAMILQFVLLLWAACFLAELIVSHRESQATGLVTRKFVTASLIALLAVGGASSLYQLCMLRVYTLLSDEHAWKNDLNMASGRNAFFVRSAYAQLDRIVPADSVVQYNPESSLINQMLIYSRYQQADASSPGCMTVFGGSLTQCATAEDGLQTIFDPSSRAGYNPPKAEVDRVCRALRIDVLVVNALDPVWERADSWVWQDTPVVQNEFVRIYRCGSIS
jgi:hypothetical protein